MVVPLDFFWIWMEVCDLPAALTTKATLWMVRETIGPVLNVDHARLRRRSTRVRVTLPLNSPVRMDRRLYVDRSLRHLTIERTPPPCSQCRPCRTKEEIHSRARHASSKQPGEDG
ncbi:hypothetical protein ACLB2K_061242 [Fragaria x ananassa]